jgi:hypothetical protein
MTTMKAARVFEQGGPEKMLYGEYDMPEVGELDVFAKVMASSFTSSCHFTALTWCPDSVDHFRPLHF